jgi:16S rRNA (uracil1498-N3)-methyltransferase
VDDVGAPELSPDDARHLAASLRLRPGEHVIACDGRGSWRVCVVVTEAGGTGRSGRRASDRVLLEPAAPVVTEAAREPEISVAFALPKGDRPESIVRGLVETGVDRIVPLITERTVVRPDERAAAERVSRLRRVAREAAMQSRRAFLPEVADLTSLARFVAASPATALCVPGGAPPTLGSPSVVIGPEGGFSDAELAAGLPTIGIGSEILRSETAAVTAGALLVALRSGLVAQVAASAAPGASAPPDRTEVSGRW